MIVIIFTSRIYSCKRFIFATETSQYTTYSFYFEHRSTILNIALRGFSQYPQANCYQLVLRIRAQPFLFTSFPFNY
jgi:hypothetical protein